MIRRIILFLGVLFAGFFVYRRYDKPAADSLLYKIKNLSFSKSDTYTTTIYDTNGSGKTIVSDTGGGLLEKFSDTMSDKTGSTGSSHPEVVKQILHKEILQQGVTVPGISGKVVTQTGPIETISAQPIVIQKITSSSSQDTLSQEDKRQAAEVSQMFSN